MLVLGGGWGWGCASWEVDSGGGVHDGGGGMVALLRIGRCG